MKYRPIIATATGASKVIRVNSEQPTFKLGLFFHIPSGSTAEATTQYTYMDPEGVYPTSFEADADWRTVDDMGSLSADMQSNIFYPVTAVRLSVASVSGEAQLWVTQSY